MSDFYKHKNPHRLFRDKENAVLAGVCAGIADYFGFNRKGVQAGYVPVHACSRHSLPSSSFRTSSWRSSCR